MVHVSGKCAMHHNLIETNVSLGQVQGKEKQQPGALETHQVFQIALVSLMAPFSHCPFAHR